MAKARKPVDAIGMRNDTVVAYILDGHGYFDDRRDALAFEMVGAGWVDVDRDCRCGPETTVLYERSGQTVEIVALDRALRIVRFSGKPLGEPIARYGPIVMNTQAEHGQEDAVGEACAHTGRIIFGKFLYMAGMGLSQPA
ncbi:pirin-like C-terminal cupin domain-containing protein [Desulfovibrio sp. TomC]|uniref:pirin-like C-terminal cupin domain-containing protein n=1 Tax=Desulfovibrio sp. TomC TaxID=1562888 RepID=UPI000575D788|nr:pirin-like C-terminal cupin domain-containing protein [Desulfovibrio sp. TomC]KHK02931.1 Pirin-like protein YhhW, possibly qercetin 2,3-dioxygenase activity [Desulfovibrio sp. TomC]